MQTVKLIYTNFNYATLAYKSNLNSRVALIFTYHLLLNKKAMNKNDAKIKGEKHILSPH